VSPILISYALNLGLSRHGGYRLVVAGLSRGAPVVVTVVLGLLVVVPGDILEHFSLGRGLLLLLLWRGLLILLVIFDY
jgi:hypothetical protein